MHEYIILDIECSYNKDKSPSPWFKDRFLSSIGIQKPNGETTIWFFNPLIGDDIKHIKDIQNILYSTKVIVGHNIKFDLTWLHEIGLYVPCSVWCTMVGEYLIRGQRCNEQSLNAIANSYGFGSKVDKMHEFWELGVQTDEIPIDVHTEYLTQDLTLTHNIYKEQLKLIEKAGISKLVNSTFNLTKILSLSEWIGAPFNRDVAEEFLSTAESQYEECGAKLKEISGIDFNAGSPTQLASVMYGGKIKRRVKKEYQVTLKSGIIKNKSKWVDVEDDVKGLGFKCPSKMMSRVTGQPSTSKNVIDILIPKNKKQEEFLSVLKNLGNVKKMASTLLGKEEDSGWLNLLSDDGRLHGNFNQTITVTGRLSSSKPNMQNIPRTGTSPLKKVFIPINKDWMIIDADLAQIEWRIAAELSRDKVMLQELKDGVDIHSLNAILFFKVSKDTPDFKKYRQASKTISFRLLYGGSAAGFANDSRMPKYSIQEWEQIVDSFYDKYSGLKKWQEEVRRSVKRDGYLRLPSGRIIPSPFVTWGEDASMKSWMRQLGNYPIQAFSADVINHVAERAFTEMSLNDKEIMKQIHLILMVHDSLVFEVHKDKAQFVINTMEKIFSTLSESLSDYYGIDIAVPLSGECKIGLSYGDTIDVTSKTFNSVVEKLYL